MKAAIFKEYGGCEKLEYTDFELPKINYNEVLIEVKACALNHLDLWVRQGIRGSALKLPHILGNDISGIVKKVDKVTNNFKIGDEVVISPGISCGNCQFCLQGKDSYCRSYEIIGAMNYHGGYAEYVKVPIQNVLPFNFNLSFEEVASLPLVFLTAWNMLTTKGKIKMGETILIYGAGSGVGSAAIQIAKMHGLNVISTVGNNEKIQKAKDLGADEIINHNTDNLREKIKEFTNKQGVDIVFDHIGEKTWENSIKCLKVGGRMVTCGATTGPQGITDIRYIYSKQLSILGSYMASKNELIEVLKFVQLNKLKPVVDTILPLQKASQAHKLMEERKHFGKIVLTP